MTAAREGNDTVILASPFMEDLYRRNPSARVLPSAQESVLRIILEVEIPTLQECATAEEFESRVADFVIDWASHGDEMEDDLVQSDFDEVLRFVSDYKAELYPMLMSLTWDEATASLRLQLRK